MKIIEKFPNVYELDGWLATKSICVGTRVYGERIVREGKDEYRTWDLHRSKLAAAIKKGLKEFPIAPSSKVLYLGAASGTTASHISDILTKGELYCVEFAQRSMRDLIAVCEARPNMVPIFADARTPSQYSKDIGECDVLYQDVAQPDQSKILLSNANACLKYGGFSMLCIKSQSIDVTKDPKIVYEKVIADLEPCFEVLQKIDLHPYDEDHLFLHLRKK
ncbi:fibrillarin-like rRNA/tRNA 2'-O-methyltransferase [Candidatus Micrarchaeota archaeon]|nr:fibrillarin-like rRNA/tRNA 2'-O-methyltransferase [Candidatus Micrarchaeota archaeon]